MNTTHSDLRRIAQEFADALVAGDYNAAHQLLTTGAKAQWPQARLRDRYTEMVNYFPEPPGAPEIDMVLDPDECDDSKPGDIGVAYMSIQCEDEGEGVLVVVCKEGDSLRIREIEWGRP